MWQNCKDRSYGSSNRKDIVERIFEVDRFIEKVDIDAKLELKIFGLNKFPYFNSLFMAFKLSLNSAKEKRTLAMNSEEKRV